jgi:hypothetical protein
MNDAFMDEVISMNNFRYSLIKKHNEETATAEELQKINELADEIEKYIKTYFEELPVDFILDQLANLGQCPNLLNDDNGHWAVICAGFQNVVTGDEPEDVRTSFYVEAANWKNTPREALKYHLFNEE